MKRLTRLLQAEPAALGTLLASVLPALVLLGALQVDEKTVAALVVAVNAISGFAVRIAVTPSPPPRRRARQRRAGSSAPAEAPTK